MNIISHISQLLYTHDCVILPGFGGFVTNYNPARINHVHQTFYPPSKALTFNSNLRTNDGLLATHVSQYENIQYTEALQLVETFSNECRTRLLNNERLSFEGIGSFVLNYEGKIEFEPYSDINYLADAYGLSNFTLSAVRMEVPKIEARNAVKLPSLNLKLNWHRILKISVPAAAILLLALVLWIAKPYVGSFSNLTSLWPFSNRGPSLSDINIQDIKPSENTKKLETPKLVEQDDQKMSITNQTLKNGKSDETISDSDIPITVKEIAEEPVEKDLPERAEKKLIETPDIQPQASSGSLMKYNIIGGSFGSVSNAQKAVKEFSAKGYHAFVVEPPVNGFYRVCVFATSERSEAESRMQEIKESCNPGSWLLIR